MKKNVKFFVVGIQVRRVRCPAVYALIAYKLYKIVGVLCSVRDKFVRNLIFSHSFQRTSYETFRHIFQYFNVYARPVFVLDGSTSVSIPYRRFEVDKRIIKTVLFFLLSRSADGTYVLRRSYADTLN